MTAHMPMGSGPEFDMVRTMLDVWGDLAEGVGSDAAELRIPTGERVVVSTDSSVENVHFRSWWMSPREIACRATVSALSDLAAAGATPLAVTLALTLPAHWREQLSELAAGVADALRAHGGRIVGGDISAGSELALCITVLGTTPRPLNRSGARQGDVLLVTGNLGGSGLALDRLLLGESVAGPARARFVRPEARMAAGRWFSENGASACIDISDGLASELGHLAAASDVSLLVDLDMLPIFAGATPTSALISGEEYELLVALPAALAERARAANLGVEVTVIGEVCGIGAAVEVLHRGRAIALPSGYTHFS